MLRLIERLGPIAADQATDTLTLPFEQRVLGRLKAVSDAGRAMGLFLDRGPVLRDGEGLRAEGGEVVRIRAAVEPVVTARIAAGLPMARLAYHLGNRHVQLALGEDEDASPGQGGFVRFPPDHVLEALAERLGASLEHHRAPFDPEPGAYSHTQSHAQSHTQSRAPAPAGEGHGHHPHHHGHGHDHAH